MRKSKPMTHGEKTQMHNIMGLGTIAQSYFQVSIKKNKSTVARLGHAADFFFEFHVRTYTWSTCARQLSHAHVDHVYVRTWSEKKSAP